MNHNIFERQHLICKALFSTESILKKFLVWGLGNKEDCLIKYLMELIKN
jgi:hypothetical protein